MDEPIQIKINIENKKDITLENEKFHKMVFLYNALNDGWKTQ